MSWRIVVVSRRAKLDYKLNYLVVRGEETTRIHLSEISTLIVESTEVSLTAALLAELTKNRVKVIFCDEKRNPSSELVGYYGSHDSSAKIRGQIRWSAEGKGRAWTAIVSEKIRKQRDLLAKFGKPEAARLTEYLAAIAYNDATNREGHAAKVYFNALFGKDFSRSLETPTNAALNYGYALMLSAVNREIVKSGFLTQLGIFHDNVFNPFNLGCDLVEPFRPLVDSWTLAKSPTQFEHEEKMEIVDLLNRRVVIDDQTHYLNHAIGTYCRSVLDAISREDASLIRFCQYEL